MITMTIVGHLVSNVVLRTGADNQTYAILRLASDRHYKDKSGIRHTDYVSVKVHGRLAKLCDKYCYKGCKMAVVGDFELIPREDVPESELGFLVKAKSLEFHFPLVERKPEIDDTTTAVRQLPQPCKMI
jgi:hypothetical protein